MRHRNHILKLVNDGFYKEAISLHSQLHSASLLPHEFTFPPLLKACAKLSSPLQGQILHAHLIKAGFQSNVYTATALTDFYMKHGILSDALKVFDETPGRNLNLASLNATISGFSRNDCCREALLVFGKVGSVGFRPNSVTVASALPACAGIEPCLQMHCWAIKLGVVRDVYVATGLVTVYCNCGEVILATKFFEEMQNKSVVSYNAFVSGLLQNGVPSIVLNVFKDMRECSSENPNSGTLVSVIAACASLSFIQFGKQVHGYIIKSEVCYDIKVGTAIVDMYSKCGRWQWAYDVFSEMNGNRNLITWNSMIAGMMLNGQTDKAIQLFESLESESLEPDSATWNSIISGFAQLNKGDEAFIFFKKMQLFGAVPSMKTVTSLLRACASLSALQCGKEIHGHAIRTEINTDDFLATALVNMYMKCGYSSSARRIFNQFGVKPKDPAFWNAVIFGYGINGEGEAALDIFYRMLEEKVEPNSATFVAVLSTCSHTGQVEKGWQVFRMMTNDYGLNPKAEHIGCMVDLLGRAGRLEEAMKLIHDMPDTPASAFASLLGACWHHLCSELGEKVAIQVSQLEPEDPTSFVILSNIYAGLGKWGDVEIMRQRLDDSGLLKLPGYSSVGVT
ncbi:hypothetical protein Tsubulata_045451 [Turnera subulata]|uniref:Pentacotripeptide-repeat region of PRORP domain-containing protein n=1 Tax=Turnera subulata TaxID=218843 RepID=A0A9Q0FWS0_9ROSI|nr:hypothetical protein Tsubulata_045451 [Turnera subulata]